MRYIFLILLFSFPAYACDVDVHFSPNQRAEQTIVDLIHNSKSTIHLAAYQLTSRPIIAALEGARGRGLEVKAVLDRTQRNNQYPFEHKITYKYRIMHNKTLVLDNSIVLTGSYNFTKSAERYNAENFVLIKDCPDAIKKYEDKFQQLWKESQ